MCEGVGYYPDPADCSTFYRCTDPWQSGLYQKYMFQCAPGTVFDQRISVCNHPWAVPACGSNPPPVITSTQPPPPPPSSAAPTTTTTVATSPETTAAGYTPSAGSAYDCPAPGFVKYEADCQKFWLCKENPEGSKILESLLYRCPDGYLFANSRLRCAPAADISCVNSKTSLPAAPFYQLEEDMMDAFFNRFG